MIVDSKHDLNVYIETNENGTRKLCCGSGTDNPCCERPHSCCSEEGAAGSDDLKAFKSEFKDTDLNEWAGKYRPSKAALV